MINIEKDLTETVILKESFKKRYNKLEVLEKENKYYKRKIELLLEYIKSLEEAINSLL